MITIDVNRLHLTTESNHCPIRILDIGCGTGRHAVALTRFANTLCVGSDICFTDLKQARDRFQIHCNMGEASGQLALLTADILNLPFQTACFDVVICSEVLEHIPDDRQALAEVLRVLKPGGTLVVSVPRFVPEWLCWALSRSYRTSKGGHIRIYRKSRLKSLLTASGLRLHHIHYAHAIHSPYWWLKCLFGLDNDKAALVRMYHRFLVWDMMKQPAAVRFIDRLLNPLIGKSIVMYLTKAG